MSDLFNQRDQSATSYFLLVTSYWLPFTNYHLPFTYYQLSPKLKICQKRAYIKFAHINFRFGRGILEPRVGISIIHFTNSRRLGKPSLRPNPQSAKLAGKAALIDDNKISGFGTKLTPCHA